MLTSKVLRPPSSKPLGTNQERRQDVCKVSFLTDQRRSDDLVSLIILYKGHHHGDRFCSSCHRLLKPPQHAACDAKVTERRVERCTGAYWSSRTKKHPIHYSNRKV